MSRVIPDGTLVSIGGLHADTWGYSTCVGKIGEIQHPNVSYGKLHSYSVVVGSINSLSWSIHPSDCQPVKVKNRDFQYKLKEEMEWD